MITIGTINNVLVSFTMVASDPARLLNAYPAATTLDVSLTEVPTQSPNVVSVIPSKYPNQGNSMTVSKSKMKVADIA